MWWVGKEEEGGSASAREKGGGLGDGWRAGVKEARVGIVWRARSKPANHEAESAYVTGGGGAAGNVMKFSAAPN